MPEICKFGILTVSDRASSGIYEDRSGPAIESFLSSVITSPYEIYKDLISDNKEDHCHIKSICCPTRNKTYFPYCPFVGPAVGPGPGNWTLAGSRHTVDLVVIRFGLKVSSPSFGGLVRKN